MNLLPILTIFLTITSTSLAFDSSFRCGDDWIAFDDEKCYKVVNKSLTKEEAISACGEAKRTSYLSSIVTIKSSAEQKFIKNYLFNELGIDDNVWIGAKRDDHNNNESLSFEWEDGSKIVYQNWAKNRPTNDQNSSCVQMQANNGKWVDLSCHRKGIVICEKLQIWTFPELLNYYFEWRRHLQLKNDELNEKLILSDSRVKSLEKSVNQINKRLSSLKSDFDEISYNFDRRLNQTFELFVEQNKKSEKRLTDLEQKTDSIVDGMLALHDECSNGCSDDNDGASDGQLETIKKEIIKEIEAKLEPIENKLENTVTDARLAIISYRRTLQIKKRGKWTSLGHV